MPGSRHAVADGTVLNMCEKRTVAQDRELIRKMLEASLHEQAHAVENRGCRLGRALGESTAGTGGARLAS